MQLTADQIRTIFEKIKRPYRDYATYDEFYACVKLLYPDMTERLFRQLFQIIDANNNQQIELDEFTNFIQIISKVPYDSDEELYYELADVDGNRVIDLDEALRICKILDYHFDEAEITDIINFYGRNQQMNKEEFCQFMR